MSKRSLSLFWIEDQLNDFIDDGWEVMRTALRKRGFDLGEARPAAATTVAEAEVRLDEYNVPEALRPDVILLDLMLPQDADDVLRKRVDLDAGYLIWFQVRRLKKWPLLADIPIIVITARGRPEYIDQMRTDPRTRWLPKPADPAAIAETIVELRPPASGGVG